MICSISLEEGHSGQQDMTDPERQRRLLLRHLKEQGIRFSRVSSDKLNEKAVVEFSLNHGISPCILCGPIKDGVREITSIAHEAGHVLAYNEMSREDARLYLCSMFASHKMGLSKLSPLAQGFVLKVESEASANGLYLLRAIGVNEEDLTIVKKLMSRWYASYEKLCHEDVIKKIRKEIIKDKKAEFLLAGPAGC